MCTTLPEVFSSKNDFENHSARRRYFIFFPNSSDARNYCNFHAKAHFRNKYSLQRQVQSKHIHVCDRPCI